MKQEAKKHRGCTRWVMVGMIKIERAPPCCKY